jgi:hypothetical protein
VTEAGLSCLAHAGSGGGSSRGRVVPILGVMKQCPGCGYIVPGGWTECRRCGASVAAPATSVTMPNGRAATLGGLSLAPPPPIGSMRGPEPVAGAGFGAPDDALIPCARPRGAVPDTMLPRPDPALNARNVVIAVLAAAIVAAGVYSMLPSGSHPKAAPTILAPLAPSAGLPTSLSAVVRIAAESARHTALTTVIETAGTSGAPVSLAQLAAAQPDYQWLPGNAASTTNTVISITSGPGIDVIAVSGTDRDICAFGRWSTTFGSDYVTMAHVTDCAATSAPTTGWTSQPGGSAQDLPGADGT